MRHLHKGQLVTFSHCSTQWRVLQVEDNGAVCECVEDPDLKKFIHSFLVNHV